jgi:hypothetical protein
MLAMTYSRMQKPHTTIGAGRLNCRVRDGTGCVPTAQITNKPSPSILKQVGEIIPSLVR